MGKKKIDIEKINEPQKRQITFYKRNNGLIKKLYELSDLCGAKILLVIVSDTNRIHIVCTEN